MLFEKLEYQLYGKCKNILESEYRICLLVFNIVAGELSKNIMFEEVKKLQY